MSKIGITGILLCGGNSSRFGSDKALAELNGVPFLVKLTTILLTCCEEVVISVKNFERLNLYRNVLCDYFNGVLPANLSFTMDTNDFISHGPARGLYSCLKLIQNAFVMVLPVDMPLIAKNHLNFLRKMYEIKQIRDEIQLIGWFPDKGRIPYPFFIGHRETIFEILTKLKTQVSVPLKKIYDSVTSQILLIPFDCSFLVNFNYPPLEEQLFSATPFVIKSLVLRHRKS